MKSKLLSGLALSFLFALHSEFSSLRAQGASINGFTYQGRLNGTNGPANGLFDFQFSLHPASFGTNNQVDTTISLSLPVTNGLFTAPLSFPLAGTSFDGNDRWLEIAVRASFIGSNYTILSPRQQITAAPYAIRALSAANGGIDNLALASDAVDGAKILNGSITSVDLNGSLLSNTFWNLGGNAGTTPGPYFLGTTDDQPLELKVHGSRGLRLEPTASTDTVNVIGGSAYNSVGVGVQGATIGGGGSGRDLGGFGPYTNRVEANFGTLSGGLQNTILPFAYASTIGGGYQNLIRTNTGYAVIGGGFGNTIQPYADFAAIGGGGQNAIPVNASYATIPGGRRNSAASYAFAAGNRAKANHTGAFVWADSTDADFASTANNQFLIRASGGVGIGTTNLQGTLHVANSSGLPQVAIAQQNTSDFARLQIGVNTFPQWILAVAPSATPVLNFWNGSANVAWLNYNGALFAQSFNPTSDRNVKENFKSVSPRAVLDKVAALPISEWNFKTAPGEPHIGPMAQDFHAAFGTGSDDKHIATVDADGVALAAIQGLNQKVETGSQKSEVRIQKLETENAELKQRLTTLEKLVMNANPKGN